MPVNVHTGCVGEFSKEKNPKAWMHHHMRFVQDYDQFRGHGKEVILAVAALHASK